MEILVYIAYDGDDIGGHAERAALTDDEHGLTMLSEGVRRANVVMNSFAVEHGGRVVSMGGDEGVIAVPASALSELEPLREMYFECAGATVSMGVGRRLSEASKALMAAKVRGKDQIAMYDPEVDGELDQVLGGDEDGDAAEHEHAQDRISDEEEAPPEEGQETDAQFKAEPDPSAPTLKQRIKDAIRRSSGTEQKAEDEPEEEEAPPQGEEKPEEGPPQEGEEKPEEEGKEGDDEPQSPEELQQIVAGALEAMKGQQQALEALSQQAPEVYQAVVSTVQAMIDMAHYALGDQAPEADAPAEAPEGEEGPPQEGEAPAEEKLEEEAPAEKAEGGSRLEAAYKLHLSSSPYKGTHANVDRRVFNPSQQQGALAYVKAQGRSGNLAVHATSHDIGGAPFTYVSTWKAKPRGVSKAEELEKAGKSWKLPPALAAKVAKMKPEDHLRAIVAHVGKSDPASPMVKETVNHLHASQHHKIAEHSEGKGSELHRLGHGEMSEYHHAAATRNGHKLFGEAHPRADWSSGWERFHSAEASLPRGKDLDSKIYEGFKGKNIKVGTPHPFDGKLDKSELEKAEGDGKDAPVLSGEGFSEYWKKKPHLKWHVAMRQFHAENAKKKPKEAGSPAEKAEDEHWKPGDMAVLQGKHRVKVKAWNGKPGSDVLVEHPRYKGDVAVEYRHLTRPPDFKKAGLPLPENTNKRPAQNLPVGATRRGEKKVENPLTGEKRWTSVQTGQVKGPSGAAPAGKPKFIDVAGNPVDKQGKPKK